MKRSPIRRSDPATVLAWQRRSARRWRTKRSRTPRDARRWADMVHARMCAVRGVCEAQGPTCTTIAEHGHHVHPRSQGGTDDQTPLAVCPSCHARIHSDPAWAKSKGFLR